MHYSINIVTGRFNEEVTVGDEICKKLRLNSTSIKPSLSIHMQDYPALRSKKLKK